MSVGLFVPCYVDQLRPEVGLAAVELLERHGIAFDCPADATCCGQVFLTAGARDEARRLGERWAARFASFDHVVTPSGSCAATLRHHLPHLVPGSERLASSTYELCEYLVDVARVPPPAGRLDLRVGLHASCHALRGLRLGAPSELREPPRADPARVLLAGIEGLELVELARRDECCGFGGVFAVEEEAVSERMGLDRLDDHARAGAQVIASTDVSCLLHLQGLAARRGDPVRVRHVAQLLVEAGS